MKTIWTLIPLITVANTWKSVNGEVYNYRPSHSYENKSPEEEYEQGKPCDPCGTGGVNFWQFEKRRSSEERESPWRSLGWNVEGGMRYGDSQRKPGGRLKKRRPGKEKTNIVIQVPSALVKLFAKKGRPKSKGPKQKPYASSYISYGPIYGPPPPEIQKGQGWMKAQSGDSWKGGQNEVGNAKGQNDQGWKSQQNEQGWAKGQNDQSLKSQLNVQGWTNGQNDQGWKSQQNDQGWTKGQNDQGWKNQQNDQGWTKGQNDQGWKSQQNDQGWTKGQSDQGWKSQQNDQGWTKGKNDQGWKSQQNDQGWTKGESDQGWQNQQNSQGWTKGQQEQGWKNYDKNQGSTKDENDKGWMQGPPPPTYSLPPDLFHRSTTTSATLKYGAPPSNPTKSSYGPPFWSPPPPLAEVTTPYVRSIEPSPAPRRHQPNPPQSSPNPQKTPYSVANEESWRSVDINAPPRNSKQNDYQQTPASYQQPPSSNQQLPVSFQQHRPPTPSVVIESSETWAAPVPQQQQPPRTYLPPITATPQATPGWTRWESQGPAPEEAKNQIPMNYGPPMHNFGPPHSSYGQPPPIIGDKPMNPYAPKDPMLRFTTDDQRNAPEHRNRLELNHHRSDDTQYAAAESEEFCQQTTPVKKRPRRPNNQRQHSQQKREERGHRTPKALSTEPGGFETDHPNPNGQPPPKFDTNYNSPGMSKDLKIVDWMPYSAKKYEDVPGMNKRLIPKRFRTLPHSLENYQPDPEHEKYPKLTYDGLSKRTLFDKIDLAPVHTIPLQSLSVLSAVGNVRNEILHQLNHASPFVHDHRDGIEVIHIQD